MARSTNNLIKYTHAALVTRIWESAAARCSLSAAEFRNRDSVVLFTDRHEKDAKMCVLLLTTAIYLYNLLRVRCERDDFLLCVCTALLRKGGTVP